MLGWCTKCGVEKMPTVPKEEETGNDAFMVSYYKYDKVKQLTGRLADDGVTPIYTEHLKLCKVTAPIGTFMAYYREKLQYFVYHFSYMRITSRCRRARSGFAPGDISLIMDYSEKLNKMRSTQVQSQHWDTTAMTIEVAVAEGYKPELDAARLREIAEKLRAAAPAERGRVLDELAALQKKIYYHCSSYKPQVAAVTTHNMEVMLKELQASGELAKQGGTVWLKTDGCAKQYKCGKAFYLLCKLAEKLNVTVDQMLEVTGHGKDEADGHGGVFKNWLLGEMQQGDFSASVAPSLEAADVVDGQVVDVAEVLCAHARAGLTDLKPAAMNSKRRAASNLKGRHFRTYTEADIGDAPAIKPMTDDLSKDAPAKTDYRTKATLAHNNYRADSELIKLRRKPVIAVRRLACACEGCRQALQRPIATRYSPHDTCAHFAEFGRLNDWKLVELEASDDTAAEIMADDEDLQVQERTDEMLRLVDAGDYLAMVGEDPKHAPDGYYMVRATGAPYELEADTVLPELRDSSGQPLAMPKGTWVVDVVYLNKVPGSTRWYTPFEAGDAKGRARVPSHMVLMAGVAMEVAVAPAPPQAPAKKKAKSYTAADAKREAVARGATVLPLEAHAAIMDELDARDL